MAIEINDVLVKLCAPHAIPTHSTEWTMAVHSELAPWHEGRARD